MTSGVSAAPCDKNSGLRNPETSKGHIGQHKFVVGRKSLFHYVACRDFVVIWTKSWNNTLLSEAGLLQLYLEFRKHSPDAKELPPAVCGAGLDKKNFSAPTLRLAVSSCSLKNTYKTNTAQCSFRRHVQAVVQSAESRTPTSLKGEQHSSNALLDLAPNYRHLCCYFLLISD